MSQEEVAFKASISPAHLGQIERATKNPTIETVEKIAVALDVSLIELFSFEHPVATEVETPTIHKINAHIASMNEKEQIEVLRFVKLLKRFKSI